MAYRPTEADRNTVKTMAACGVKHEDIARCLGHAGIDDKTLRKHFRQELDTATARANSVIGSRLYAAAERGEPWAVCFWLKTRARWRETSIHEHTGPDGKPIQETLKIEVTGIRPTKENT
jgi:hypothetical protein